jgi:hypothetical protein
VGLEARVGAADRRVSGLPALRGRAPSNALASPSDRARLEIDSRQPAVNEVIEIRLGFDGATGRLAIADGDVRHPARERALATTWPERATEPLVDPIAAVGSRVDLVA